MNTTNYTAEEQVMLEKIAQDMKKLDETDQAYIAGIIKGQAIAKEKYNAKAKE